MVLHRLVLGHEVQKVVLADNAAEAVDDALKLVERLLCCAKSRRLFKCTEGMVLYLADTLAGDTVALAYSLERNALRRLSKTKAGLKHGAGALRERGQELFDYSLGLKACLVRCR